jgi:hypothetical protein
MGLEGIANTNDSYKTPTLDLTECNIKTDWSHSIYGMKAVWFADITWLALTVYS